MTVERNEILIVGFEKKYDEIENHIKKYWSHKFDEQYFKENNGYYGLIVEDFVEHFDLGFYHICDDNGVYHTFGILIDNAEININDFINKKEDFSKKLEVFKFDISEVTVYARIEKF